jgi:sec-independent protein translocase protein TatB
VFGLGFTEILLIIIVAIVFLGPEKLPSFLVDTAKFFKGVKKAIDDAKTSLDEEVRVSELKEEALSYKEKIEEAKEGFGNFETNIKRDLLEGTPKVEEGTKEEATLQKQEPVREVVNFQKVNKEVSKDV